MAKATEKQQPMKRGEPSQEVMPAGAPTECFRKDGVSHVLGVPGSLSKMSSESRQVGMNTSRFRSAEHTYFP